MEIKFWGTRGSIPAPGAQTLEFGGNTTCVEVVLANGRRVVIDGGTGLRLLGQHLMENHIPCQLSPAPHPRPLGSPAGHPLL